MMELIEKGTFEGERPLFKITNVQIHDSEFLARESTIKESRNVRVPIVTFPEVPGDLFGRDNLDFQSKEIATISALVKMEGVNTGLTETQMKSLISVLKEKVGRKEAKNASKVLEDVLSKIKV